LAINLNAGTLGLPEATRSRLNETMIAINFPNTQLNLATGDQFIRNNISGFLVAGILVTELVMLVRGGYRKKRDRLFRNILFFSSATVAGALIGAYVAGEAFAIWLTRSWILAVMTALSGVSGAVGWWLGEKVVTQLQKAGKIINENVL